MARPPHRQSNPAANKQIINNLTPVAKTTGVILFMILPMPNFLEETMAIA